jgi:hypothetical protein
MRWSASDNEEGGLTAGAPGLYLCGGSEHPDEDSTAHRSHFLQDERLDRALRADRDRLLPHLSLFSIHDVAESCGRADDKPCNQKVANLNPYKESGYFDFGFFVVFSVPPVNFWDNTRT